jgi:hypothetical protein
VISALKTAARIGTVDVADEIIEVYRRFAPEETDTGDPVAMASAADARTEVRAMVCATAGVLFAKWSEQARLPGVDAAAAKLIDLLIEAIVKEQDENLKAEAAVALGNLYHRRYDRRKPVMTLIVVLGVERVGAGVKSAAHDSLQVLTDKSFGMEEVDRWERWFKENKNTLAPGR